MECMGKSLEKDSKLALDTSQLDSLLSAKTKVQ